jgi:outer membrane receptor protein involved in Fe transport
MNNDINAYLSADKFTMNNGTIDFYYLSRDFARNHTFGYSDVKAAFGMLDYDFTSTFRFAGGVRVEHAEIYTDVDLYNRFGFKRNDPRRANLAGFPLINPGELNETNILPSGSLIYKIKSEKIKQSNLRLNYSQTIARPSIRELNDAAVFDNEYRTLIYGNSDLKTVHIKNFDFRGEACFNNGDNISASLFYKDFTNHIEMGFGSSGITWDNIKKSSAKGIEIEGKKSIGKYIELRTNVTLVKSNSQYIRKDLNIVNGEKVYTPIDTVNRTMYGQAPYIVNSIVTFKSDSLGLVLTASYNVQGPRLVITGVVKGRPDVYEIPRNTIDAKISKKLGKYFSVNLTIRDILNAPVRRAYKLPSGWVDYDKFRYGTNYVLGISYKL